jgi:thiamine pyrophosphokinase
MKTCFIFGSIPTDVLPIMPCTDDLVIAADGGLKTLKKFNINPDLIVGDFDSLEYTPVGDNVIKHPVQKDETDTILAIDVAMSMGYDNFLIYGCLGGRLDHTVASIQTASYVSEKNANCLFIDNETYLIVIKETAINFNEENKGIISIFSLSENAVGVSASNLLYELENSELTSTFPLGVSNEFIGKPAKISVKKGTLCVIWNGKHGTFKIGG